MASPPSVSSDAEALVPPTPPSSSSPPASIPPPPLPLDDAVGTPTESSPLSSIPPPPSIPSPTSLVVINNTGRLWASLPARTWKYPSDWDPVRALVGTDPSLINIDDVASSGRTPFLESLSRMCPPDVVKAFLEARANPAARDEMGLSAHHLAAMYDRFDDALEIVQRLVVSGVELDSCAQAAGGESVLHFAARSDNAMLCHHICQSPGVDPNVPNSQSWTPVHAAASVDALHSLTYLVTVGQLSPVTKTRLFQQPQDLAPHTGPCFKFLKLFTSPKMATVVTDWRLSRRSPTTMESGTLELLLDHAGLDGERRLQLLTSLASGWEAATDALWAAIDAHDTQAIGAAIQAGADLEYHRGQARSALLGALTVTSDVSVFPVLIEVGKADVNLPDKLTKNTIWHLLCSNYGLEHAGAAVAIARYLSSVEALSPALLTKTNIRGDMPIHVASRRPASVHMLHFFIQEQHVPVDVLNRHSQTPLGLARAAGDLDNVAYLLVNGGADPMTTTGSGSSFSLNGDPARRADIQDFIRLWRVGSDSWLNPTVAPTVFDPDASGRERLEVLRLLSKNRSDATARLEAAVPPANAAFQAWTRALAIASDGVADLVYRRDPLLFAALRLAAPLAVIRVLVETVRLSPTQVHPGTGESVLHVAAGSLVEVTEYLLSRGADMSQVTKDDGLHPLHVAAQGDNLPVLRLYVEEYGQPPALRTSGGRQKTPLQLACANHSLTTASYLVCVAGVELELFGVSYLPRPFRDLIDSWSHPLVKAVVRRLRTNTSRLPSVPLLDPGLPGQDRLEVLLAAVPAPLPPQLGFLTKACRTTPTDPESSTDLLAALEANKEALVTAVDAIGNCTALHLTTSFAVTQSLVSEFGFDPNATCVDGRLPLHFAAADGDVQRVRFFVEECGVDINARDDDGKTVLHFAETNLDVVGYAVVVAGADPKSANASAWSFGGTRQLLELWTQTWMQNIIKAWRHDGTPPTSVTPDMYDTLFQSVSSGKDRLSVLRFIARHHQTNLVVRCVTAGMTGVGKTTLVKCATTGSGASTDPGEAGRTQGLDVSHQRVAQGPGLPSCRIVWQDFGGHSEYWSLQGSFLQSDCVLFLCVDLTRARDALQATLHEVGLWLDGIADAVNFETSSVGLVVVGTKVDQVDPTSVKALLAQVVMEVNHREFNWRIDSSRVAGGGGGGGGKVAEEDFDDDDNDGDDDDDWEYEDDDDDDVEHDGGAGGTADQCVVDTAAIKLMAVAATSSVTGKASVFPSFSPHDTPPGSGDVVDIPTLMQYVLSLCPSFLPGYFGVEHPAEFIRASELVLSTSSGAERLSLFKGRWVLSEAEFAEMAPPLLHLPDGDVRGFVKYMASIGAFVACGGSDSGSDTPSSWVIVDPSRLAAAVSSVLNHRYVGVKHCDPDTEVLLGTHAVGYDWLEEERAEMADLVADVPLPIDDILLDEERFVTQSVLTKRFLTHVLLNPRRRRCRLGRLTEASCDVVWQLLGDLEHGVELDDGMTMVLPAAKAVAALRCPTTTTGATTTTTASAATWEVDVDRLSKVTLGAIVRSLVKAGRSRGLVIGRSPTTLLELLADGDTAACCRLTVVPTNPTAIDSLDPVVRRLVQLQSGARVTLDGPPWAKDTVSMVLKQV